jgi:exopolysaccharide biosynthesis polyprenyl glycosylphosphotransferase
VSDFSGTFGGGFDNTLVLRGGTRKTAKPLSFWDRAAKRAFDLCATVAILVAAAPLMAAIALAIRLEGGGPVLFRQTRGGLNGRPFKILKFRSMHATSEEAAEIEQARPGDPRITRLGAILRRTSLDELPQLFNVLRGDMSLVGPRPHCLQHDRAFAAQMDTYVLRQRVAPGVTGWAQVHGARGPTPTPEQVRQRIELDLWYVRRRSLALDLAILLRTPAAVIRGGNAV